MTVPSETTRSTYSGSGVTTVFSTGFYFQTNEQVRVRVTPSGGVEAIAVEGVDYTVTRPTLGSGAPGSVTFTVAPPNLAAIIIERVVDLEQNLSLRTVGTFSPAVHEDKFDELTFQVQQVKRDLDDVVLGSSSANIAAGSGLTSTGSSPVTLHVGAGDGVIVNADDIELDYGVGASMNVVASDALGAANEGSSPQAARIDHQHMALTAIAGTIAVGDSASQGAAFSLSRSDHRHALPAPAAPADVTKAAASAGASTTVARADHKHDVSTAAAVALTDSTNAEGVATSLARSDHTHAHGNRGGGTLHANAVSGGAAGFMTGADKALLDALTETRTHVNADSFGSPTSLNHDTDTVLVFNQETLDTRGEYDPTTGVFTAQKAGIYHVTARAHLNHTAAQSQFFRIELQKNGVTLAPGGAAHQGFSDFSDQNCTRVIAATVQLAVSDTLRIVGRQTNSASAARSLSGEYGRNGLTIDRMV
jgi:hypothetical protein